jgi:hypothetical protein
MKKKPVKDTIGEEVTPEEEKLFISLRAATWREFAGQETVK